ncbi:hypothetical protein P3L10_031773 [Capsicum annuum]
MILPHGCEMLFFDGLKGPDDKHVRCYLDELINNVGIEGKDAMRKFANEDEYKQWIKQGNGYDNGFSLSDLRRAETLKDLDLPIGAPPEYHYHFADLWMCYSRQLLSTNGMNLDSFPGEGGGDAWPLDLKALGSADNDLIQINDLAELVIKEYNEESNFHKYELLKIEKVNLRETTYAEYFITIKVRNLTLGTVVETFQIHAGQQGTFSKEVFFCLLKGGVSTY